MAFLLAFFGFHIALYHQAMKLSINELISEKVNISSYQF